ncbi:MAG TPA: FAD-linked oxidase C-terminal domain-containing protein [Polyangiales bacterium]|nr:FAD-linked oxidase C-terminal domain-containing protein [Polyangiales bacterium]
MTLSDRVLCALDRSLGSGRVLTDPDILQSYATDESEVPPHPPQAVVRVQSAAEVESAMRICAEHLVPVTPRAGGTGRTGGAVPLSGGLVMAFENMQRIKGIETGDMIAVVEPGVVLADLHRAVEALGLFYPPDPNSLNSCAIGGNVAENAGGPRALRYGCTRDYVLGMNIVTPDGEALSVGKRTVKGVTGYDLTSLLVGSEGTLAITTEITLKLLPKPQAVATLLAALPSLESAGRAVTGLLGAAILPRCMELMDEITLGMVRPQAQLAISEHARALLLIELDGDEIALDAQLERAGNALEEAGAIDVIVARHGGERERLWAARRELSHALRRSANFKLAEDVVVPRSKIPQLIDQCQALSERFGVLMPCYGHAGDGNIHVNFLWNDPADEPKVHHAIEALFRAVIALGGTLTGEHGIGVLKAPYLSIEQSPRLIALQEQVKNLFDPKQLLNPGKIFPAHVEQRLHKAC